MVKKESYVLKLEEKWELSSQAKRLANDRTLETWFPAFTLFLNQLCSFQWELSSQSKPACQKKVK